MFKCEIVMPITVKLRSSTNPFLRLKVDNPDDQRKLSSTCWMISSICISSHTIVLWFLNSNVVVLVATTSFGSVTEFIPPSNRGQGSPDVGVIPSVRTDVAKLNQVGHTSVTGKSENPNGWARVRLGDWDRLHVVWLAVPVWDVALNDLWGSHPPMKRSNF